MKNINNEDLYIQKLYEVAVNSLSKVCGMLLTTMSPQDVEKYLNKQLSWECMEAWFTGKNAIKELQHMGQNVQLFHVSQNYHDPISDEEILDRMVNVNIYIK